MKRILLFVMFVLMIGCGGKTEQTEGYDSNTSVPAGDPAFTPLTNSWIIDNANVLEKDVISRADAICQKLQDDRVAEVVVLIQLKVKQPLDYATHYGRWLKLGSKGYSTEGGNNGVVWLIRPDADEKITISIGRGLPKFTSQDAGKIMDSSKDYINFNNYSKGVLAIVQGTDEMLRKLNTKGK